MGSVGRKIILFCISISLYSCASTKENYSSHHKDDRWLKLGALAITQICLAQDAEKAESLLRNVFKKSTEPPEELKELFKQRLFHLVESPWARCINRKQPLSEKMCRDFVTDSIYHFETFENATSLFQKHYREIGNRKKYIEFTNKTASRRNAQTEVCL